MPFDPIGIIENFEKSSPTLSRRLAMLTLRLMSPFNSHLKMKMNEWNKNKVEIELACHRGARNHVGSIHAAAHFTLGETCAGLLIIRHFRFKEFRPLMSEVNCKFVKQARGTVKGRCQIKAKDIAEVEEALKKKKVPFLPMKTVIVNDKEETVAEVNTLWQIKPWEGIKVKK